MKDLSSKGEDAADSDCLKNNSDSKSNVRQSTENCGSCVNDMNNLASPGVQHKDTVMPDQTTEQNGDTKVNNLETGASSRSNSSEGMSQTNYDVNDVIEKVANIKIEDSSSQREPQEHPDNTDNVLTQRGPGPDGVPRMFSNPQAANKSYPMLHTVTNVPDFPNYQQYSNCYSQETHPSSSKRGHDTENDPAAKYNRAPQDSIGQAPSTNYANRYTQDFLANSYYVAGQNSHSVTPAYNDQQLYRVPNNLSRVQPTVSIPNPGVTSYVVHPISNMAGGTVIVKSPEQNSQQLSFTSDDYDSLLKNLEERSGTTQLTANVNVPSPAESTSSYSMVVSPQSSQAPKTPRHSKDIDSGVETASEYSPYSEHTNSPPPSNLSQSSEDSAMGKSPMSQENVQSPASDASPPRAGTSPPQSSQKYSFANATWNGMFSGFDPNTFPPSQTAPSSMTFDGQYRTPVTSVDQVLNDLIASSPTSVKQVDSSPFQSSPLSNTEDMTSAYIDRHLPELSDLLAVLSKQLMEEQQKKQQAKSTNLSAFPESTKQPQIPIHTVAPQIPGQFQMCPQQVVFSQSAPVMAPARAPVVAPINPPPQHNTGLIPVTVSAVNPPVAISPAPPNQNAPPIAANPQHMQTVLIPVTSITGGTTMTNPQPSLVILCPAGIPIPPKLERKQPRKIAPKLPYQPSAANGNGIPPPKQNEPVKKPLQEKVPASPAVSCNPPRPLPGGSGCLQQAQQVNRQQNLLNLARRTVADISSQQLRFQDEEGDTYLHVAVCRADKIMVQALLERLRRENLHTMVDVQNKSRQTPLYLAVADNQPAMVHMFITFGADVNIPAQVVARDGISVDVKAPIHCASCGGKESERTLQELLKAKDINVNSINSEGQTALHCAIAAHGMPKRSRDGCIDSVPIVDMLIREGADPNAQDKKNGKTPLMYAIEGKDYRLVEALIRLIGHEKIRTIIKTQTFDGRNCMRIAEGLKIDYGQQWPRICQLLSSASSGELPKSYGR